MAKSRSRTIYGDFQTPPTLAAQVCRLLRQRGIDPRTIVEPTCGVGSFLLAALQEFPRAERIWGLDVNPRHLRELRSRLDGQAGEDRIRLRQADFFATDWSALLRHVDDPLLVIGNPPWVTSATLGELRGGNLPRKANIHGHSGLDALTGKANFDISEWMLLQSLKWLDGRVGTLAMFCKMTVARKVLRHAWRNRMQLRAAALFHLDALATFGAAVAACLLVCEFAPASRAQTAQVHEGLEATRPRSELGWRDGEVVADASACDRWRFLHSNGREPGSHVWRSGIKHDCARVMELRFEDGVWRNGLDEAVDIEPLYLFPMLKGAEVARGSVKVPTRWMIVPQATPQDDTSCIRNQAPRTWAYLEAHAELLEGRRSSVYRNRPRFAVFGIGPYSFLPHKVAICGFYDGLRFEVVGRHQRKPIVFDDTVYFLSCRTRREATGLAALLNSRDARAFYSARTFSDAKRPVTAELLRRLDLTKLARHLQNKNKM